MDFTLRDGRVEEACTFPQTNNPARSASDDDCIPEIFIDSSVNPEAAQHARDAIANGKKSILTIDRPGASQRRRQSTRGTTCPDPTTQDRDEYPPALFLENGGNASVRCISLSDNRRAGVSIKNQCLLYPNGTKVRLTIR